MNMVSKGVQNVLDFLQTDFPDMDVIGISGRRHPLFVFSFYHLFYFNLPSQSQVVEFANDQLINRVARKFLFG